MNQSNPCCHQSSEAFYLRQSRTVLTKLKSIRISVIAAVALAQTGAAWTVIAAPSADCTISNHVLAISTSTRDAGAVCSIVFDGKELVNDYDHGRQVQVAWAYNGLDEAYNPTEAGARSDGSQSVSSSEVVTARSDGATLTTASHPAYWWNPGTAGNPVRSGIPSRAGNIQVRTKDTLKKTITLGRSEDLHVIVLDSEITVSPLFTGPAPTKICTQAPAFYTCFDLTEHALFNRRTGVYTKSPAGASQTSKDPQRVPILSSPDGRYAVAMYTPQARNFLSYDTRANKRSIPASSCNKLVLHFAHPVQAGRTYSYRTFLIIGDLETVKASLKKLPESIDGPQTK
jgi:hypothetical protein